MDFSVCDTCNNKYYCWEENIIHCDDYYGSEYDE
jgi:hypothetical protein